MARSWATMALAAVCALGLGPASAQAGPRTPAVCISPNRLSGDVMERLAARPIALSERGDLPAAKAEVERMLARRRGDPVADADLLTAFGVHLNGPAGLEHEAPPYFARALELYRSAFGPDHPEVAWAQLTYAEGLLAVGTEESLRLAEPAGAEAYRIRAAVRGPDHLEAVIALGRLAEITGRPARTEGRDERIAASAALFEQALAAEGVRRCDPTELYLLWKAYMRMYVDHGRLAEAEAVLARGRRDPALAIDESGPFFGANLGWALASLFEDAGHTAEAVALRKRLFTDLPPDAAAAELSSAEAAANRE